MSREHSVRSLTSVVLAMTGALQTTDLDHKGGISNLYRGGQTIGVWEVWEGTAVGRT